MSEIVTQELVNEAKADSSRVELGRVTVLEALAQRTTAFSPDKLGRCTMQGNVDFDD